MKLIMVSIFMNKLLVTYCRNHVSDGSKHNLTCKSAFKGKYDDDDSGLLFYVPFNII